MLALAKTDCGSSPMIMTTASTTVVAPADPASEVACRLMFAKNSYYPARSRDRIEVQALGSSTREPIQANRGRISRCDRASADN